MLSVNGGVRENEAEVGTLSKIELAGFNNEECGEILMWC